MSYARVEDSIWEELRPLPDAQKLMEVYLRTCKHRTKLGLFVLPPQYAEADLEWDDPSSVVEVLNGLQKAGRIGWDPEARVVYVPTMHVDPPQNRNVVTHALKELRGTPKTPLLLRLLGEVEAATDGADSDSKRDELAKGIREICSRHGLDLPVQPSGPNPQSSPTESNGSETVTEMVPQMVTETAREPSPNGSRLHIQDPPQFDTTSTPTSDPRGRAEVNEEEVSEVWNTLEETIRNDWHLRQESIQVGQATITMAREEELFRELAGFHDLEPLAGAIRHAPEVFDFDEPHSLLWFTSKEHGPANYNTALGAYFKADSRTYKRKNGSGLQKADATDVLSEVAE